MHFQGTTPPTFGANDGFQEEYHYEDMGEITEKSGLHYQFYPQPMTPGHRRGYYLWSPYPPTPGTTGLTNFNQAEPSTSSRPNMLGSATVSIPICTLTLTL